jgi:hypothetical protein
LHQDFELYFPTIAQVFDPLFRERLHAETVAAAEREAQEEHAKLLQEAERQRHEEQRRRIQVIRY